jgi:superfamily II DNA or RNA helicase
MTLVPVDDVWIRIECDDYVARELSDYFAFDIASAKFMPQFKKRHWTGKIHLFKLRGHLIYRGLVSRVVEFAEQRGYPVTNMVPYNPHMVHGALESLVSTLPLTPRVYQLEAVLQMMKEKRGIVLSPTGSGKSLIIYMLMRVLDEPTLIVVPTTGLVSQMVSDFAAYGMDVTEVQTIQAGHTKDVTAPIVVSTWQSIYDLPKSYFEQFKCVIVDEVHLAKAKSLTGILEKCVLTPYRFGFTGTLDDTQAHRLILEGLFGNVTKVTTTKQLVENKQLAPLKVKLCVLKYPETTCRDMRKTLYQDEVEFLVTHPTRLEIVSRMAANTKGNVLVLFNFVEKHGKPLYQRIRELAPHRDVHFVSGEVDAEEREHIRQWVTNGEQQIIVASYGTTSTGINIPNIGVIVFASPSKSKIRVLQSIGRSLRLHESKTHATLIDVVDDLRIGASVNHTFRHAEQRVQYYSAEHFPYTMLELTLDRWLDAVSGDAADTSGRSPMMKTNAQV